MRPGCPRERRRNQPGQRLKDGAGGRGEQPIQQPSAGEQVLEQDHRRQTGTSLTMSQNRMRVPRFGGPKIHVRSGRFQYFLTARGLVNALEPASDPFG